MRTERRAGEKCKLLAAALAGTAVVIGGGGTPAPLPELALQCLAALVVGLWLAVALSEGEKPFPANAVAWRIAALVLVLPVVQLLPLPPAIWQALNGRELERSVLALAGAQDTWQPISMLPARTFASLLAMVPAVAMLIMVASLGRSGRVLVMAMVSAMAMLGLVIGAGQIAAGEGDAFRLYPSDMGHLNGFQANHNSAADMLLIAMVGVAATIREFGERRQRSMAGSGLAIGLTLGAAAICALGVVLTASRTGIMLLPVACAGTVACLWPHWHNYRRRGLALGLASLLILLGAGYFLSASPVIGRVLQRFDFTGEYRVEIWRDSWFAVRQVFPWGSGMGTFEPLFQAAERLEAIGPRIVNRAHNDYLELLLEGGALAAILLVAVVWTIARAAWRALRQAPASAGGQVTFAITALVVIALHSTVDYPLRSMSLAFVAAICVALLMPLPVGDEPRGANV